MEEKEQVGDAVTGNETMRGDEALREQQQGSFTQEPEAVELEAEEFQAVHTQAVELEAVEAQVVEPRAMGGENPQEGGLSQEDVETIRRAQRRNVVVAAVLGVILLICGFFAGRAAGARYDDRSSAAEHIVVSEGIMLAECDGSSTTIGIVEVG